MAATLQFDAPSLAGRYRLLRRLGAGGMGEVWSAEQLATGREVAIKLLPPQLAADPDATARIELEARTLCRVRHGNVVRVIDFGRDAERGWFLATELLPGETLAERLDREGVLEPAQAVRVAVEILEGLRAVHDAEIVHRDLKPENVMLVPESDGAVSVRLLDFGIAKLVEPGHRVDLTVAGQLFGTPAYLAPEQALGRAVDRRTDLYACGVVLYRALSGRLPFEAETATALALLHASQPAPPLPEHLPGVLRAVVEQALEKDPEARFSDADEMRRALLAACPDAAPLRAHEPTQPRAVAPAATPQLRGGVSRIVLAAQLIQPDDLEPGDAPPAAEGRSALRLGPSLIAREVVECFGGRISVISENGLLADFASPTDTLQCAAAIHDRMVEQAPKQGFAVDVRIGIAAGEVVRTGRTLRGAAVAQAEALAEAATAGEVVFTQGVYLAMTRSEVTCEPWPGRDPGVGQKLYRLCEPPQAPRPELPYGGSTLQRTEELTFRRVVSEAGRIGAGLAARLGRALPDRARQVRRRPLAIALALALGGGAAIVGLVPSGPAASVEAALEEGRAAEARELAEAWMAAAPEEPRARAYRGRALALEGRLEEARTTLRQALAAEPALARNAGVAAAMVRTLDEKGADRSLVLEHRTAAVDRALVDATRSIRYWERWNAARTLEKLGLADRIDWVEVYLLDLQHAGSCGTRLRAARKLATLGEPRAVETLLAVKGTKKPGWACNLDGAIDDAVAKLRSASASAG